MTTTRRTSPSRPDAACPGPVRTVSSTNRFAVPTSSGAGPHSASTGRPATSRITSPARTSTPGPASGLPCVRRRRLGRQHPRHPPAVVRAVQVGAEQTGPARPVAVAARRTRTRGTCRARPSPPTARRPGRCGCPPRRPAAGSGPAPPAQSTPAMSATQKWSRIRRLASSYICRHSAAGSTVTTMRRVSISNSSASPFSGAVDPVRSGAQHPQGLAVTDDEARAVAADRVGAHRVRDHVELAAHQVVALEDGPVRLLVVRPCGSEHPLDGRVGTTAGTPCRTHPGVEALPHRDRHDPVDQPVDVDHHLRRRLLLRVLVRLREVLGALRGRVVGVGGAQVVGLLVGVRGGATVGARAERRRRAGGQRDEERPPGRREREVERMLVVDRVEAAPRQEGQVAAVGGEGRASGRRTGAR